MLILIFEIIAKKKIRILSHQKLLRYFPHDQQNLPLLAKCKNSGPDDEASVIFFLDRLSKLQDLDDECLAQFHFELPALRQFEKSLLD